MWAQPSAMGDASLAFVHEISKRTIQEQNMKCKNEPGTWTMKCVWWALHGTSTMLMKSWAMVMDKSGTPIARGEMVVVMVVGAP
jgi:hypothetical protein